MAYIENGKYGIASNETEWNLLKRKRGIDEVFGKHQYPYLIKKLDMGDSIYVIDVASFAYSACDFWKKLDDMERLGISFVSENQKYLKLSREYPLSEAIKGVLRGLAYREDVFTNYISGMQGVSNSIKQDLINKLCGVDIITIQDVFANGGIKKRGN